MATEFLHDNKPKLSLKKWICTVSHFIDPIQFHLIFQMLAKCSWVESERTVSKFRKRKRKILCCVHQLHKAAREIRKFHVAIVQRRLRNVQKSVMHVEISCFANINLFFLPFYCRAKASYCCDPEILLPCMVTWRHTFPLYNKASKLCTKWRNAGLVLAFFFGGFLLTDIPAVILTSHLVNKGYTATLYCLLNVF